MLATGHAGEAYLPPNINFGSFQGDRVIHSSQFTEPQDNGEDKKAVLVGCCNSGHDIARDDQELGYDVTMVQRSSTLVHSCDDLVDVTMKGLYAEDGVRIPAHGLHRGITNRHIISLPSMTLTF